MNGSTRPTAGYLKQEYTIYETAEGVEHTAALGNRLHGSLSLLAREHDADPDWNLRLAMTTQLAGSTLLNDGVSEIGIKEGVQATPNLKFT